MCRHTGTNVYAEFFFLTCPHTHRHADTHGQHSVPEQTAASTFSSVFLSPSLLVSSSHIRRSSSNPPSPNLAVILYYQTSAEAKLEAQLLQQKTLRALLCEELLWQQRERERAELKKKKTHKKESRWPKCGDPPFLSQPPDASASPNAPCRVILTSSYHNYIFGALLTASLIYDISRYLFTHGGGAACISVSLEPEMNQSPGRKDELSPGQPRSERLKKGPEVFELVKFFF